MSIFICEKCGYLDNTACGNNYWHASGNKYRKREGLPLDISYSPEFQYFEDHVCCSECCNGITYKDGSGIIRKTSLDLSEEERRHWSEFGRAKLFEWERRHDGSMVNATEYFKGKEILVKEPATDGGDICVGQERKTEEES